MWLKSNPLFQNQTGISAFHSKADDGPVVHTDVLYRKLLTFNDFAVSPLRSYLLPRLTYNPIITWSHTTHPPFLPSQNSVHVHVHVQSIRVQAASLRSNRIKFPAKMYFSFFFYFYIYIYIYSKLMMPGFPFLGGGIYIYRVLIYWHPLGYLDTSGYIDTG